ncbi:hypothetical protein [Peribacillus frigoritolerans]|uniref:Uncharacterized protein n=1 Tax=Peribacillus castrilensis TaxID=2897690 RepID=A0AAW9NE48_9BACI|nr:hypothetical protein [Peribacillus castrilensis]
MRKLKIGAAYKAAGYGITIDLENNKDVGYMLNSKDDLNFKVERRNSVVYLRS